MRTARFERRCNLEMVDLEALDDADDLDFVQVMLMKHVTLHGQPVRGASARGLADAAAPDRQGHAARVQARARRGGQAARDAAADKSPVVA